MPDTPGNGCHPAPIQRRGTSDDSAARLERIRHEARASLGAAVSYGGLLMDRLDLAQPHQFDALPPDLLVHLAAVCDALEDGARRALLFIEPAVLETADMVAEIERARVPPEGA